MEKRNTPYPKSIFLIIATEFCERFSFCGLRTILSLYLRNVLRLHENSSTVIYHLFMMLCYFVPVLGAILADNFLGRYSTICYFSIVYTIGNILMCLAAIPPISYHPIPLTITGLVIIAAGTGGIKPCVAAFGGDQFRLPQQEVRLHQFFSIFYFTINFGGFVGMVMTPILRKAFTCFGDDTCYALGFGFPAALMVLALFLFLVGKPLYRMKAPKGNILLQFIKCSYFAFVEKYKTKDKSKAHWLDYAVDTYDEKLIGDMKIMFAMLFLLIPLPLFWSLFDQQGSRWTFQATHMNGELWGFQLLPDQMQVINPAIVLVLIPFFDYLLYPLMDKLNVMTTMLQKMMVGGIFAGFAFIASGILELKLEETYPVLAEKHQAHVNIINALPCDIQVFNPFNQLQLINASKKHVFQNVIANKSSEYNITILTSLQCGNSLVRIPYLDVHVSALEHHVESTIIGLMGSTLNAFPIGQEDLEKSLSGKPRLRIVFLRGSEFHNKITVKLEQGRRVTNTYYVPSKESSASAYMEVDPGRYKYAVFFNKLLIDDGKELYLELGGVYNLILQEYIGDITFSNLFVMTPPNSIHMLWLVPQYIFISVAEIMFGISGLKFYCTQAPSSMKTVSTAAWYVSVALGNLLVIIITQARLFRSQAYEFFLLAVLIIVDMVVFSIMSTSYKYVCVEADCSSTIFQEEMIPLLDFQQPALKRSQDK